MIKVKNLEQIDKGSTADIYELDSNTVLKIFPKYSMIEVIENDGLELLLERIRESGTPVPEPTEIVDIKSKNYHHKGVMMPYLELKSIYDDVKNYDSPENSVTCPLLATYIGNLHASGVVIEPTQKYHFSHVAGTLFAVFKRTPEGIIAFDWTNFTLIDWINPRLDKHRLWEHHIMTDLEMTLNFSPLFDYYNAKYLSNEYFDAFKQTCHDQEFAHRLYKRLKADNFITVLFDRDSF